MLRQLNESEKHGLAAADAPPPERADWTIDQGWESYTAEEHGVWKTLFERQSRLLPGRACDSFVRGMTPSRRMTQLSSRLCSRRPIRVMFAMHQ